jgi:small subunit ribosomal protein S16
MSVTIRLSREGKKNAPSYKIVVSNTRDKREGNFVDILGFYNPTQTPVQMSLDKKKLEAWKAKGALITDAVQKIVDGKYTYVKYNPKAAKEAAKVAAEPAKE